MEYKKLGKTDLMVSEIGFGCQSIGGGLYDLFRVSKNYANRKKLGKSLLWSENKASAHIYKLSAIFLSRILGPFSFRNFSNLQYSILLCIGEKAKALGFISSIVSTKISEKSPWTN